MRNQVYWAIQNEQYNTLDRLIEHGVDINLNQGRTHYDDNYANTQPYVQAPEGSCFTPLVWAASLGLDHMVEYLLDRGADIQGFGSDLCNCSDQFFHARRQLPACPRFKEDDGFLPKWTSLHYAICKGHESTAKLLLARGASTTCIGDGGATALHAVARWGMGSITDHLIENKLVDIDAQDGDGVTALHVAYVAGNFSLVDKLLDHGADINLDFYCCDGEEGLWTIFLMACSEDRLDKALEYLRKGADPGFVFEDGCGEKWTAMRLIYGPRGSRSATPTYSEQQLKFTLEQEIFRSSGGKPPVLL